jgi:hypothetical protein
MPLKRLLENEETPPSKKKTTDDVESTTTSVVPLEFTTPDQKPSLSVLVQSMGNVIERLCVLTVTQITYNGDVAAVIVKYDTAEL